MAIDYEAFLATKAPAPKAYGFRATLPADTNLFPFQAAIVRWALERGRAAVFADCGLGKSLMQLEWAWHVARKTGGRVLILTPLAVAAQTEGEARKFGVDGVAHVREPGDSDAPILLTNYERLHKFDPETFAGVVLDESSVLKNFSGTTKRRLLEAFARTPYRLACTATPAPNDHLELGNHAEFLGVLSSHEMIARWFINDSSTFGTYRLKGHAIVPFWDWVGSWARCAGLPSDLGAEYSDEGYVLPELRVHRHVLDVDVTEDRGDQLFRAKELSATVVHKEKRRTAAARASRVAELVRAEPAESWLVWCDTDYEADALMEVLPKEAVEVRGSDSAEAKERGLTAFARGELPILVSKPSLAGHGLNFQHCARMAFVGTSYSFEAYYQALRRAWRFGQTRPVEVHVAMASTEVEMWAVLTRKAEAHEGMKRAMFAAMRRAQSRSDDQRHAYLPVHKGSVPAWLTTEAS